MRTTFNLDATIERRAQATLQKLLARGGYQDWAQARKYAAAAGSWCRLRPETGSSRRRGGATSRMWARIVELCDQKIAG